MMNSRFRVGLVRPDASPRSSTARPVMAALAPEPAHGPRRCRSTLVHGHRNWLPTGSTTRTPISAASVDAIIVYNSTDKVMAFPLPPRISLLKHLRATHARPSWC